MAAAGNYFNLEPEQLKIFNEHLPWKIIYHGQKEKVSRVLWCWLMTNTT